MPVEGWLSLAVVVGCMAFVVVNVGGELLVTNTTPAGGDMGAHVWGPAYLRDELLTQGRLSGWTQDWYAGFPAYHFYMVVPSLAIALLSLVIPYGIAFKLVAVSGIVTMPASAWAFGRLTRLPFPAPALLAVGATAFLFDRSFSIYGGNVASTMAGEFAFSISLSLTLVYLGVLARGLRTGRHRVLAPVLLALVGLCHLIPAFFAIGATVVMVALHPAASARWRSPARKLVAVGGLGAAVLAVTHALPEVTGALAQRLDWDSNPITSPPLPAAGVVVCWAAVALGALGWVLATRSAAQWRWLLTTMPVAGLLGAFWVLPFYLRSPYMNDMGWEKKTNYGTLLFDRGTDVAGKGLDPGLVDALPIRWVLGFAVVGLVLSLVSRRRAGAFLGLCAAAAAVAFWVAPEGRLWNARLTPFYYLCLYLLGGVGVAEGARLLATLVARDLARPVRAVRWAVAGAATLALLGVLAMPLRAMPGGALDDDGATYRWGPFSTTDDSFVDAWATWNFTGYERKPAYPEYRAIVATMAEVGDTRGCGRAMWEHEEQHDRYGTPMALMLLPFWTDGCIGSMEGLYFEASSTTPYHFLNQDQLSTGPSNAQRDLPYGPGPPSSADFDLGVAHLQMLGVRYYMAISDGMQAEAAAHPDLAEVASSGPWRVYEVAGAELVEGLAGEPVVVPGADAGGHTWQDLAVCWYQDRPGWNVPLADDGPASWRRVERTNLPEESATPAERCQPGDWGWFGERPEARPQPPVAVTDITAAQDAIAFRVDQVGVPVLVKASYFPNWSAEGADGPWRVAPNLMVVVPTAEEVTLRYGWTGVDLAGIGLSALGLVALALLWRAGPVAMRPDDSWWAPGDRGDVPVGPTGDGTSDDLAGPGAATSGWAAQAPGPAAPPAGSGAWTPTAGYDPGEPAEGTWAPPTVPIHPEEGHGEGDGNAEDDVGHDDADAAEGRSTGGPRRGPSPPDLIGDLRERLDPPAGGDGPPGTDPTEPTDRPEGPGGAR
jgi:hypothetical protein